MDRKERHSGVTLCTFVIEITLHYACKFPIKTTMNQIVAVLVTAFAKSFRANIHSTRRFAIGGNSGGKCGETLRNPANRRLRSRTYIELR